MNAPENKEVVLYDQNLFRTTMVAAIDSAKQAASKRMFLHHIMILLFYFVWQKRVGIGYFYIP